jgi:GntR family transcriptional regulator/MocR family aminotransferase
MEGARQHLGGLLEISNVRAGLCTIGYLKNEMNSRQTEKLAAQGLEVLAVDRCTLRRPDPNALLLGFGGFDELAIRKGLIRLARALSPSDLGHETNSLNECTKRQDQACSWS